NSFTFQATSANNSVFYLNPKLGGPADAVLGPNPSNALFVSDYGDGRIYRYALGSPGSSPSPTPYLSGLTAPTYMAEFTNAGGATFTGHAVPEPSSLVLLGLGATVGLVARRRLRRAKAAA
ncbi:MAG TPA: PEP-CTERM sorting domain-containing protein, partial [Isosphaeraceae bacterium]|nr:PEP-CTERM sorting domain-containing protein [Isosphaeraceae bacterium]